MTKTPKKRSKYHTITEINRQVKNRQEELQIDYYDKIKNNKEAMDFLQKFNEEEVLNSYPKKNDFPNNAEYQKALSECLNNTKEQRKRTGDHNNARNRDMMINMKVRGLLDNTISDAHLESKTDRRLETHYNNHENDLVAVLDNEKILEKREAEVERFQNSAKWKRKYAHLVKKKS